MANTESTLVPGTSAHFDAWCETQDDVIKEGAIKGFVRYQLAPLSARQMAAITVSLTMTVQYYRHIGRDTVPLAEIVTALEMLVADPE
jgi:hypothetical protein